MVVSFIRVLDVYESVLGRLQEKSGSRRCSSRAGISPQRSGKGNSESQTAKLLLSAEQLIAVYQHIYYIYTNVLYIKLKIASQIASEIHTCELRKRGGERSS